ncbi:MAG: hypothetical protein RL291_233 [Pseudomonadota bacterium]
MPSPTADQIEAAISHPAPGQVSIFLDYEWLVPIVGEQPWGLYHAPPYTTDYLFTRPERFEPLLVENQRAKAFEANPYPLTTPDGWNVIRPMKHHSALDQCVLTPMRGREVFPRVLARGDYHTIHINPSCGTYDDPRRNGELRMPCGWTPLWAEGIDPRPEARILPVHSIAEIHVAMRQFHLVRDAAHRLEYIDGVLAAVYEGNDINGKLRRQAFTLVEPQAEPRAFAQQCSEVLCGGQLAYMLDGRRWDLKNNFHEGTRLKLHEYTPDIVREIDEILKMLDGQVDQLPPRCFRTEFAPSFVARKPHVITGAWLRETRQMFADFANSDPLAR